MFELNFSKISEMFYPKIGSDEETDLRGFFKHAFGLYFDKYRNSQDNKIKKIEL